MAAVSFPLDERELADILCTFDVVAGEVDDLPTVDTRHLWSAEALKEKDLEAAEYEQRMKLKLPADWWRNG
jgi:hypothetical protein